MVRKRSNQAEECQLTENDWIKHHIVMRGAAESDVKIELLNYV